MVTDAGVTNAAADEAVSEKEVLSDTLVLSVLATRMRLARVAVMLAQCGRSRVRCDWPRHVRGGWRPLISTLFFGAASGIIKAKY